MEDQEIEVLIELMKSLTTEDIKMLHKSLHVPGGVCDDECEPIDFLAAMYKWEYLDPYIFHDVLKTIRPDLISKALNVPWLYMALNANLPYEIKVRGNEFTWEYYKACDEGSLELKFFRLMIVGPEGAGKTSLLKALKGLCFDENEISTDFIEKTDITITDLNKDWSESVNFKKQLQETRDDIVAKITVENVRELAKSSGESKLDSPKEDDGRILTDLPVNEESVSKVDSKSHSLTHEYIKSKFSKIMHKNLPLWREMHKRWKNEHTMDPIDFFTVWDLAGQSYLFCMHSLCDVINFCFIMLLLMVCQQFSYYPSFQDIMSGLYASKSY